MPVRRRNFARRACKFVLVKACMESTRTGRRPMTTACVQGVGFKVPRCELLGVEFVEPVLHVAEGAQQIQPRFAQIEPGVERVQVFLALLDARLLFGCGRKLRRRTGRAARRRCPVPVAPSRSSTCSSAICCFRLAISAWASSSRRLALELARSEYRFAVAPARPQLWRAALRRPTLLPWRASPNRRTEP